MTAKPVHGDKGWAMPLEPSISMAPALEGRYCTKWPVHDAGSRWVSGGITKKTATKGEMAAAGFGKKGPHARGVRAAPGRDNAAPLIEGHQPRAGSDAAPGAPPGSRRPRPDA